MRSKGVIMCKSLRTVPFTTNTVFVFFKQTNKQLHSAALTGSVIFTLSPYLAAHTRTAGLTLHCHLFNSQRGTWGGACLIHSCSKASCHTCTAALRKARGVSVNNHELTEGLHTRSTCVCSSLLSPEGEVAQGWETGHQTVSALVWWVCFHPELYTLTQSLLSSYRAPVTFLYWSLPSGNFQFRKVRDSFCNKVIGRRRS